MEPRIPYEFFGGDATYCIIPAEVMELGRLLERAGRVFHYEASLAEPDELPIGAFNAAYHTKMGVYHHEMGIKRRASWPSWQVPVRGLGARTYALHRDVRPSMVVVTDVNEDCLARAEALFPPAEVKEKDGIDLHFCQHRQDGESGGRVARNDRRYRF